MSPHDRHNQTPPYANKTEESLGTETSVAHSNQAELKPLHSPSILTRQNRAEEIHETTIKNKRPRHIKQTSQLIWHHYVCRLGISIDAAARNEK
jgi:hypothetical protein